MNEQRILQIRRSIAAARLQEENERSLQKHITLKLPSLHKSISLPENNTVEALINFVTCYIEHVPDFIKAIKELTYEAGIYDFTKQFINIAEDYFLVSSEQTEEDYKGLQALIDDAYLAHRLIEELSDRLMMVAGIPLAPMDMTMSNVLIHEILGEGFANELDLAVHYSIETLFKPESFEKNEKFVNYVNKRRLEGWKQDLQQWPCLAGDSFFSLDRKCLNDIKVVH
ncbi:hypothetical protein [Agarilytica rhodophyticola]|uniref:hypothetical protein n=1 Tax=Agarilytica rhodophyticola TaxID=1737490 RepID=UPI000B34A1A6|nr:hypothetical protein [Agarilytica rhodophyticola]